MAKTEYRVMSLEARGLHYMMRLERWVNRELPEAPPFSPRFMVSQDFRDSRVLRRRAISSWSFPKATLSRS